MFYPKAQLTKFMTLRAKPTQYQQAFQKHSQKSVDKPEILKIVKRQQVI